MNVGHTHVGPDPDTKGVLLSNHQLNLSDLDVVVGLDHPLWPEDTKTRNDNFGIWHIVLNFWVTRVFNPKKVDPASLKVNFPPLEMDAFASALITLAVRSALNRLDPFTVGGLARDGGRSRRRPASHPI
jgi:hypothetical protein